MSFSIESLRCFEAAATCLSFGVAAKRVALSPTAFSERIKRLEEDLGHRLFERNTRRVVLTNDGHKLLPHARQLLADAQRCRTALSDDARPPVRIVLGTRFELGMSWVVPALGGLERRAPHRKIDLSFGDGPELLARLRDGRIDAMISSMRLTVAGLTYARLHEEKYALVASRAVARRFQSATDAPSHRLLDLQEDLPLFRYFMDACAADQVWAFAGVEYLGTIAAVRHRVREGAGIAVLPEYFVRDDLKRRRLLRLMPRIKLPSDHFRLVWRAGHPAEDELVALAKMLAQMPLR